MIESFFFMLQIPPRVARIIYVVFVRVFFATPFWKKLQTKNGQLCMSKMDNVATGSSEDVKKSEISKNTDRTKGVDMQKASEQTQRTTRFRD